MIGLPQNTYYRRLRVIDDQTRDADAHLRSAIARVQRDFPGRYRSLPLRRRALSAAMTPPTE